MAHRDPHLTGRGLDRRSTRNSKSRKRQTQTATEQTESRSFGMDQFDSMFAKQLDYDRETRGANPVYLQICTM